MAGRWPVRVTTDRRQEQEDCRERTLKHDSSSESRKTVRRRDGGEPCLGWVSETAGGTEDAVVRGPADVQADGVEQIRAERARRMDRAPRNGRIRWRIGCGTGNRHQPRVR